MSWTALPAAATWFHVSPTAIWAMPYDLSPIPLGETTVRFENAPEHLGCVVASTHDTHLDWILGDEYSLMLENDPGAIYVRLNPTEGTPVGAIMHGFHVDEALTLDLSGTPLLHELEPRTMNPGAVPGHVDDINWRVFWEDPGGGCVISHEYIWLDSRDGLPVDEPLEAMVPQGLWGHEVVTYLSLGGGGIGVEYTFSGDWPETMTYASHEVTVDNTPERGAIYEWEGPAHEFRMECYSLPDTHAVEWTFHGQGDGPSEVQWPQIPADWFGDLPGGAPDDFEAKSLAVEAELEDGKRFEGRWFLRLEDAKSGGRCR